MKVYVNAYPRSLALATDDYALIFRYANSNTESTSSSKSNVPKCIVEFASRKSVKFDSYHPISPQECYGFLGIINIDSDIFLCVITGKTQVASPRPGETINRIYSVEFHCLNRDTWDFLTIDINGFPIESDLDRGGPYEEHPCAQVRKLLCNNSFYYSNDFDLTSTLQLRGSNRDVSSDDYDVSFMWNSYMMSEIFKFRSQLRPQERDALNSCGFLTTTIRGFAQTVNVVMGSNIKARLTVISRQSWHRAGTRYISRGIDDEGNVSNFVETETILYTDDICFGYVQIRGSVPTFWEQDVNLLSAKVNITRSLEAAQPAFNRHFDNLIQKFGIVHNINLLANKSGEIDLTRRYNSLVKSSLHFNSQVSMTNFDFHSEVARSGYASANRIIPLIRDSIVEFAFFASNVKKSQDLNEQIGVFRVNCLDCLDRTNLIQQIISKNALQMFLEYYGIYPGQDIWIKHNIIWADNGDQLSQIYAGTNALKTSFTRSGKMNLAGAIADATKSVSRLYINNFVDKGRQNTMDILLGRQAGQYGVVLHDPINDFVTSQLKKHQDEFSSQKDIKILAGTFNLNGVLSDADLTSWIFPNPEDLEDTPDLVLVGFQEIVELTAGQILNADPGKKEFWERRVLECLNKRESYVLLRSGQLVGTALMLFVKKSDVEYIRNVEGAMKKTGLGGMAGNKGGVAVSFNYANTSLCFITAHLAAGLKNVDERHSDYKVISSGLRFSRGKTIKDHDTIIWLGDFNYRVDLPNEQVRKLVPEGDFGALFEHDQLNLQMVSGNTFPFYNEMQINFPPTYKFDNGTDIYDTSEKARTPSWTDRILSRGTNLRQLSYGSAPLMFSDHRPVFATFNASITIIDEHAKAKLSTQLYEKRRAEVGNTNDIVSLIDINETTLTHGLPPPSSELRKWWLSQGQSTKVHINPPKPEMVINPRRDPNPFNKSKEPDYIDKVALKQASLLSHPLSPESTRIPLKLLNNNSNHSLLDDDIEMGSVLSSTSSLLNPSTQALTPSSFSSKTPPLVPKKPDMLASPSVSSVRSQTDTNRNKTIDDNASLSSMASLSRSLVDGNPYGATKEAKSSKSPTSSMVSLIPPPLPRRTNTMSSIDSNASSPPPLPRRSQNSVNLGDDNAKGFAPELPKRSTTFNSQSSRSNSVTSTNSGTAPSSSSIPVPPPPRRSSVKSVVSHDNDDNASIISNAAPSGNDPLSSWTVLQPTKN